MKTKIKKPTVRDAVEKHGKRLLVIFPNATEQRPYSLCSKLRKLEGQAYAIGLQLCNGPEFLGGYDEVDRRCDEIIGKVDALLGNVSGDQVPTFINRDPRGYALKIDDGYVRKHRLVIHTDMGGYGIIAPQLTADDA